MDPVHVQKSWLNENFYYVNGYLTPFLSPFKASVVNDTNLKGTWNRKLPPPDKVIVAEKKKIYFSIPRNKHVVLRLNRATLFWRIKLFANEKRLKRLINLHVFKTI